MFPSKTAILSGAGFANTYSTFFDSTDDYINCGSDSSIDDIFDGGGSISAWVYNNSGDLSTGEYIATKASGGGWYLQLADQDGTLCEIRFRQRWDGGGGVSAYWDSSKSFNLSQWNHVVVTYNASSTSAPVMYLNGVSLTVTQINAASGTRVSDSAVNLSIGSQAGAAGIFTGYINEISLFSKILSQEEVTSLYNNGNTIDSREITNLIAYWRLEEGGGILVADSSTNSNTGILTNSPTWSSFVPK